MLGPLHRLNETRFNTDQSTARQSRVTCLEALLSRAEVRWRAVQYLVADTQ